MGKTGSPNSVITENNEMRMYSVFRLNDKIKGFSPVHVIDVFTLYTRFVCSLAAGGRTLVVTTADAITDVMNTGSCSVRNNSLIIGHIESVVHPGICKY